MFLPRGDWYVGEVLSCSKGGKDACEDQVGRRNYPGTPQQKMASSGLQGRTSWFFSSCGRSLSSCDGDLRDALTWPQERPVSIRVARGPTGFLSSQCRDLGTRLELQPDLEVSSPVLTWILGFLWSLPRRVRALLNWRHAHPFSSQAVAAVSGFPST